MRTVALAVAGLLVCAACGCGTVANLRGENVGLIHGGVFACPTKPFGGVAQDAKMVAEAQDGYAWIPDLIFSYIGDVVTLPLAVANKGHEGGYFPHEGPALPVTDLPGPPHGQDGGGK